jgi:ATP-dependent RNA helicase DDX49/DBP8
MDGGNSGHQSNDGLDSSLLRSPSGSTFESLGVDKWIVASLAAMQIRRPTPIQAQTIPAILSGSDCIGGSKTGSGKTVAFAVPILQKWAEDGFGIFALILTPTRSVEPSHAIRLEFQLSAFRELALQIYEQIKALSAGSLLKPLLVTGGADMRAQAISLSSQPHIVIATPGRLADHIEVSGELNGLRKVRFVVLDEADRLLAPGSGSMLPAVEKVLSAIPAPELRQTLLFTATVTPEVRALRDRPRTHGRPPVCLVELGSTVAIPETLKQNYLLVPNSQRETYLHVLLHTEANQARSVIIFCNRTTTAAYLEYLLRLFDVRVTSLHSGLQQRSRINNLARFRARVARVLVATDVAARGLDIPTVDLVINYDTPRDADDYIHRVGRVARAGRSGIAVTFIGQRDVLLIQAIEDRVGEKMVEYTEANVSISGRVTREATLKLVGDAKREALVRIEEGRDVKGKRTKTSLRMKR